MVTSEEIIERSFYIALLHETLKRGLTINPDDYLVDGEPTESTILRYEDDKKAIGKNFIYVFGIGNNLSRGPKTCPRITIELNAFFPGDLGMEKFSVEPSEQIPEAFDTIEYDYTTKNTTLDIHLVANTQQEMRVLHDIMYRALPAKGYIKPYFNDYELWKEQVMASTGNLYIEIGNFYDHPDLQHGLLEKVYTYEVQDGLILQDMAGEGDIVPIKDISVLIQPRETEGVMLNVP
ncbi:MAG: hypothetical protein NC131_06260 [Roseburia sp.]|nr:hypothetical protein [Roseburia sp.]